jgi:hypothetical protein
MGPASPDRARGRQEGEHVVYVTGDMHGEMSRFDSPEFRRLKKGDTVIICGDFGFIWDGGEKEAKNLKKIGSRKYNVLFLDGAHENFDLLAKYPVVEWNGGKAGHISGNLYHLLRGEIYKIEGKTFFVFGGGESADKQIRMEAGKWWPCEMPTLDEMHTGVDNLKSAGMQVDYVLTHEPPPRVTGTGPVENRNQLEAFFEQITKQVKYQKWFFGFLHIDRKITYKNFAVFQRLLPVENVAPKHHFLQKVRNG